MRILSSLALSLLIAAGVLLVLEVATRRLGVPSALSGALASWAARRARTERAGDGGRAVAAQVARADEIFAAPCQHLGRRG